MSGIIVGAMSVGYCSDDETPFSIFDFLDVYTDLVDCVVKVNVVNVVYDKVYTVTEVAMEEILTCLRECFTLSGDGGLCLGFECTAQFSIANGLEKFKTSGTPIPSREHPLPRPSWWGPSAPCRAWPAPAARRF